MDANKIRRIKHALHTKQHSEEQENTELQSVQAKLKFFSTSLLEERQERRVLQDKVDRLHHDFELQQDRITHLESIITCMMELPSTPNADGNTETSNNYSLPQDAAIPDTSDSDELDNSKNVVKFVEVVRKQATANGGGKSLGMLLGGGDNQNPVYVHKVIGGGAVQNQSQIAYGDLIDEVNGISVNGTAIKQVHTILKRSGDIVNLRMRRDPNFLARLRKTSKSPESKGSRESFSNSKQQHHQQQQHQHQQLSQPQREQQRPLNESTIQPSFTEPASQSHLVMSEEEQRNEAIGKEFTSTNHGVTCFNISIAKGSGSLGMAITGGTSTSEVQGIVVSEIQRTGAVAANGIVQTGDRIIAVDGKDTRLANKKMAIEYLKSAKETVHLLVSRERS